MMTWAERGNKCV